MTRYRVRNQNDLREAMRNSKRTVPHSVRSLAEQVGRNRTQVGYVLTGERPVVDEELARGIASAFGRDVEDLFLPESSQSRDGEEGSPE